MAIYNPESNQHSDGRDIEVSFTDKIKEKRKKQEKELDKLAKIAKLARKAYKNITLGTDNNPENLFILGFISGYLQKEKEK